MSDRVVRVVIADRHQVFREGLKSVFEAVEWLSLAGEAENIESLIRALRSTECEMVIADVSLVGRDRQSLVVRVRQVIPNVGVVLVAGENDLDRLAEALALGADGFLRRDAHVRDFVAALEKVKDGYHYIQPELVRPLISSSDQGIGMASGRLTPRQVGVLQGVADGMSNKQIGHKLRVSETTVKSDLRVVFAKLGVTGRAEAVAVAIRAGLVN